MKKTLLMLSASFLSIFFVCQAYASPCETLICMSGKVNGQSGGESCDQPVKDFFSIKKYHHGHLDLEPTSDARREFLNQCPGAQQNASSIDAVISAFGTSM